MKLISYCTADSYLIKPLLDTLQSNFDAKMIRDTLHISLSADEDLFIFPYGVVVTWGVNSTKTHEMLEIVRPFEREPLTHRETDEFDVVLGPNPKIAQDVITIPHFDLLTKTAISHGIAQSVELGYFETSVQRSFESTRKIPKDLVKYGRIPLSRNQIRKKMGEIFQERSSINLHADVLDLPEFFWEHPHLEPLYQMVANYLDIRSRVEVLNHRLDIMHELYEVLAGELNHQHSARLEMTIILLIIFEVIISLMHYVFHII